jgi:hypothetical protein
MISRAEFRARFKGKLARFHGINGCAGNMIVKQTVRGLALRFTANVGPDNIRSIRIHRV